jgi:hypothetical protein
MGMLFGYDVRCYSYEVDVAEQDVPLTFSVFFHCGVVILIRKF